MARPSKRILLKLSGELMLQENYNLLMSIQSDLLELRKNKFQIVIVIGAGNIIRGRDYKKNMLSRHTIDLIGIINTIACSLALEDILKKTMPVKHLSTIHIPTVARTFSLQEAEQDLNNNNILILSGGTGLPFCSTDTLSSIRAGELGIKNLYKLSFFKSMFNKDNYLVNTMTCEEALVNNLPIMDRQAYLYCQTNLISITFLNIAEDNILIKSIINKETLGMKITP